MYQSIMDGHISQESRNHYQEMALRALELLTAREKDCLSLWLLGHTMPSIGNVLSISPRTVETHLYNARGKLQQKNRQTLMLWLIDRQKYEEFIDHATEILKKKHSLREEHGFYSGRA